MRSFVMFRDVSYLVMFGQGMCKMLPPQALEVQMKADMNQVLASTHCVYEVG